MKKLITTLLIGVAILFSGCTLKGTPNMWSAMLADQMKEKGTVKDTVRLSNGFNAEIVIYDAENMQNRIHYKAETNAFNTFEVEYKEAGGIKTWNKYFCNKYPISEAIEKGLEIVYTIRDKHDHSRNIEMITNRFDCN